MDHDAAHKYIYTLPEVTADLLRLTIPGWVEELDLATLEDRSAEHLDAAHRHRRHPGTGMPAGWALPKAQSTQI